MQDEYDLTAANYRIHKKEKIGKISNVMIQQSGLSIQFVFVLSGDKWEEVKTISIRCGVDEENKKYAWDLYNQNSINSVYQMMTEAKVFDVKNLIGKPVSAIFEGINLCSWRLLKEAI